MIETTQGPIRIMLCEGLPMEFAPRRAHDTDSGFDLFLPYDVVITSKPAKFNLGFWLDLPEGIEAEIRPRSSTLLRYDVVIAHGLIDQEYQGEVAMIAYTLSNGGYEEIAAHTRIAQLRFSYRPMMPVHVHQGFAAGESLHRTSRGTGGFGSSGE